MVRTDEGLSREKRIARYNRELKELREKGITFEEFAALRNKYREKPKGDDRDGKETI